MESARYEEFMKTTPFLPFLLDGRLTEDLVAKARKELGETEEVKAKTIPELRKLVQAEPGLFCATDDAFLLAFLRARKFNVQKAFSLLQNFFKVITANSDMFGSFDSQAMRKIYDHKIGITLPYRSQDGCAVGVVQMCNWDVDVTTASEAITALTVAALWYLQEPANQVCGFRLLIDARGTSLRHIQSLIPRHAFLLARAFTNCFPLRMKGVHFYNEASIFRPVISIVNLFLPEKMKNRIHLHGNNEKHLHKFFPKAILPAEDLGGDNPNDVSEWCIAELEKYFEKYRQITTYGYKS